MAKNILLQEKIKILPNIAGCYLFKDTFNNLIYVGKAKDLKKRVTSYLNKASNFKTMLLVNDITDVDFITTSNEKEALILEQTLIKKHHPKYNILLADDKKYPYIQITNHRNPQYRYVRSATKKDGRYYGPFPDGTGARDILKLLERLFPLRKCNGNLGKPCLYYHLAQCSGACFKTVLVSYYEDMINKIDQFFKGNVGVIKKTLINNMTTSAENLQFENANRIKILLSKIDLFLSQQVVEFQDYGNRDFINFLIEDDMVVLITLFYRNGKLQAKDEQIVQNNYLEIQDLIRNYCQQLYSKNTLPSEIYLPHTIDTTELKILFPQVKFILPIKGSKEHILTLVKTNAIYAWNNYLQSSKTNNTPINMMKVLSQWIKIPNLNHLEIFDVSNLQHNASVGGMIVYKNGSPSFNDYRKFLLDPKIPDDYHRFSEMIYRRYHHLIINQLPLPDLIIVDGGKPQITATLEQLSSLNLKIPIIGLAKNQKHQTDRIINDKMQTINIPKNDACFLFLSKIQNQVHSYAIKYHKLKRSQSMINSVLATIPGIGMQMQNKILAVFPTWEDLQNATSEQLFKIIKSKTVTGKLWKELHSFS
ncbi:excinuclease ABC subunit UvrC [Spiroplasma endosymbiont of Virgichneumon dumeticola]|uniref:excinuclease ABC subunit UvrC n=1 Tax=Spiroplasma endosymbiont of Virgichneumon dumeticola TaxID=3139323 RepID=UPI0035C8A828